MHEVISIYLYSFLAQIFYISFNPHVTTNPRQLMTSGGRGLKITPQKYDTIYEQSLFCLQFYLLPDELNIVISQSKKLTQPYIFI